MLLRASIPISAPSNRGFEKRLRYSGEKNHKVLYKTGQLRALNAPGAASHGETEGSEALTDVCVLVLVVVCVLQTLCVGGRVGGRLPPLQRPALQRSRLLLGGLLQLLQPAHNQRVSHEISLVWMTTAFDPSDGNDAPKRHSHVRREGPLRSFKSFLLGIDDLERVPMEEDLSTATTEASSSPSASPWPALPPALPGEDAGAGEGGGGGGGVRRGRLELRKGCFWGGGFMVRVTVRNGNVTVTAANQRRRQRG